MSRPPLLQAVRGPGLHARRVGVGENFCAAVLADIFGVVADQPVARASDPVLDLAGGGELEALLDAALGLQLGHFLSFARLAGELLNRHGSAFAWGVLLLPMTWKLAPREGGRLCSKT